MSSGSKNNPAGRAFLDVPAMLEMGVALSMALMLSFFLRKIFLAPASVPLYYIAYRKGPWLGMFTCLVFALITTPLAMASLPHPIVWIENPLEYMAVAIAGFFPMREEGIFSFKELFRKMSENGMTAGFKSLRKRFFGWIYDTRGIVMSSILRYIIVVLGSAVFFGTYTGLRGLNAIVFSMVMEWRAAFPGLIFFMVAVPILVKYRMDFRDRQRGGQQHKFREASDGNIDPANK
ncbi:MAG: energy-coupled thiamine transporter ThiT [Candidatus Eremiobacteraeota bacterium]|nr:energy-coupled thiamine transporter ThiT [Candidatus Eremiobacteraeota bacterium]